MNEASAFEFEASLDALDTFLEPVHRVAVLDDLGVVGRLVTRDSADARFEVR